MSDFKFDDAGLAIRVIGRFGQAGKVEFLIHGEKVDEIILPRVEWATFAILAIAASDSRVDSIDEFLDSSELSNQLFLRSIFSLDDPQNAINTVYRLRGRLGTTKIALRLAESGVIEDASDFGNHLIGRVKFLGYRINVDPGDVKLDVSENF